ncbi:MAG: hypothetical protein FJZ00_02885 [Candidatus Sericytochromatia bacterium]|uniref:Transporter n=1 Tax=Candidatus Tanganyikabacteria bacterium TaxID=2961651 RepID=A0A937X3E6_9BACT|nr:hypothetical protein [Candidatus Tanganyikabacteria bacterium]
MTPRTLGAAVLAWSLSALPAFAGAVDTWGPTDNVTPGPVEAGRFGLDARSTFGLSTTSFSYPTYILYAGLPMDSEINLGIVTEPYKLGLVQLSPLAKIKFPDMGKAKTGVTVGGAIPLSTGGARAVGGALLYEIPIGDFTFDAQSGYRQDFTAGGAVILDATVYRNLPAGIWTFAEATSFIGVTGGRSTTVQGRVGAGWGLTDWLDLNGAVVVDQDFSKPGLVFSGNIGVNLLSPEMMGGDSNQMRKSK